MATNYDGLTRNTWPGTWSSSGTHPIVLDREVRGSLRFVSGDAGDQLTDIEGQRIQEGMLVYVKNTYGSVTGDKYYKYTLQAGESRDGSTGAMPNSSANWSEVSFGGSGSSVTALSELTNDVGFITDFNISVAGDDSTLRKIDSGEGIVFQGGAGITVTSDAEGNITITTDVEAAEVTYDNTDADLSASNVKAALDELSLNKVDTTALSSTLKLYPTDSAAGVGGYNLLVNSLEAPEYDDTPVDSVTPSITSEDSDNPTNVGALVSAAGLVSGSLGIINVHTVGNIRKASGNRNASFRFTVLHRADDGTETLLGTSSYTPAVSTSTYEEFVADAQLTTNKVFTATDRIVIKFWAYKTQSGGNNPVYNFEFGGDSPVRINFPVPVNVVVQDQDAGDVLVDTTAFSGILGGSDTTVQAALETLDSVGRFRIGIAADDSTVAPISQNETIQFLGASGITTTSDGDGVITITGTPQDFAYSSLTGAPTIPADVSDLTDTTNLLGGGGSDFVLRLTADDSTVREITSGETVQFNGGFGITTNSDSSGDITIEANLDGTQIELGTPSDGSLVTPGALSNWTETYAVTNSIDDLNELALNIMNNTAVANVDFVADIVSGGAGSVITLTITADGNPTHYIIDWGDGTPPETTTDDTPSHTYTTAGTYTITVTAYNDSGSGAGARVSKTRNAYIVIATADPVVTFAAYDALTGGSAVTQWDDGDTIYFENTTTNIDSATIQFTWDWGDSSSDDVITDDTAAGGTAGARIAHTFTASTEQEVTRTVTLTLDSHSTADPAVIPASDSNNYKIYDTHTPTVTIDDDSGVNEESTSGHPVTFTNTTENTIGSYSTYGLQYRWTFGDGDTQTVNVGSGAAGDTGGTISHTYTLSSSDQANGNSADYTGNLRVISDHGSSPFISSDFTIHVEPDVRANIAGTAVTVSDALGDNQYDLYDGTDYNGNDRALVRLTNTTQNGDDYVYDWADTSSDDTMTEASGDPGSTSATIDHSYLGETAGGTTYNVSFTANGTPDITAQTDVDTSLTFTLNNVPSAPSSLSAFSITLSDSYQGTLPRLAHGFTDNSDSSPLSAGADLTTTTARRYVSTTTIDTSTVNNAYNGHSGTLSAVINGTTEGSKTFTTATGETGLFTALRISQNVDYNDINSTYPTGFYQTFDAKIEEQLTEYSVGVNDQRLEHSTEGNTNYVAVVRDSLASGASISNTGTLTENTAGTYRYVSGIPYYNTGSPNLTLSGVEITNLVGQCYTNQSNIVEVDPGTNYESTSSSAIQNENYNYSAILQSAQLNSGVPVVNIGTSSAYAIKDLTVDITGSSVRTVESPRIRARNVNGVGAYSNISTKVQVHTAAQSGIVEQAVAVSDSLGSFYDDDAVRIFDFSSDTTDTPSYTSSTNFYTNNLYSESADPGVEGTQEATIRLGVIQHDVTDYSTGFLPVGPDRSSDTGTQYITFAFRRQTMANFTVNIVSSTGIEGMFFASPGTTIDDSSTLNGWLDCGIQYAGVGLPGADTGNGGNGSNGCALTGADVIGSGALNGSFEFTMGSANASNATGNVVLLRIALGSGDKITSLSIS